MSRAASLLLALAAALPAVAFEPPPPFPPGTSQFFRTYARDAVPAGLGVWVALPEGIVRYTAAGRGTLLPTPGGGPYRLALASDGSIWFANETGVGRVSPGGSLIEQYTLAGVRDIAVASDGALWYTRDWGEVIGRIAATRVEFSFPPGSWSLAPASGGAVWILGSGSGTSDDVLHRMSSSGAVTALSLGVDVLFGRLQALPDATLYVGTGIRNGLLRLPRGSTRAEVIRPFQADRFLADEGHNIWSSHFSFLNYLAEDGAWSGVQLPYDPRLDAACSNIPIWGYVPLAIDSEGGLWLRIVDDAMYFPESLPCPLPNPPEMPTLIRIQTAAIIAAQKPRDVPLLSPGTLAVFAVLLAAMGALRLRA